MKKLTLIIAVLFMGCEDMTEKPSLPVMNNQADIVNAKIVVIDGCQYIQYHGYRFPAITHKGNCNNPIHNCK